MKNNKKYIFLDFDGVVNDKSFIRESGFPYLCIDGKRLLLIQKIVKQTNAYIILSTYHRVLLEPPTKYGKYIWETFSKFNLHIADVTPVIHDDRNREITMYCKENNIKSFVILDDTDYNWSDINRAHFIKVLDGITEENVDDAIDILNGEEV